MDAEGPPLEALTRRLAECPAEFLAEPRIGASGSIQVAAVVADLARDLGGGPLTRAQAEAFTPRTAGAHRNWLALVLIAAWLLHDPWFREQRTFGGPAVDFLTAGAAQLAALAQAPLFVSDPDRREELVRLVLRDLGLRPAGESQAQATDRLGTLNTAERQRVMLAARQAEERSEAIRAAMAQKAADEAAAQYSRE
ncbi:MAG: hypothetical protein ABI847_20550 [Anaerolineales bacterium]